MGSTAFVRWLAHVSKIWLDYTTARLLGDEDAVVFYSGAGLRTIRAARRLGILSICQVHHCHVLEQERILRDEAARGAVAYSPIYAPEQIRWQVAEFESVDVILCPSETVKESFLRQGIATERLIVVPHGVDVPETGLGQPPADRPDEFRVLYVGQLHFRKGLRYLLEALSGLVERGVQCRLAGPDFGLAGVRWDDYPGYVERTGPLKGADLWKEYLSADVFVLPSVEEGFGLVVLEAMRAGLPVIVSSAVGACDMVRDGVDGFIVPVGNATAIREKIEWMIDHPEQRKQMGVAARDRASSGLGWDESAARLVAELERKILERHA
jgi:glycosyltransferase involved in cell wall biosynthesis